MCPLHANTSTDTEVCVMKGSMSVRAPGLASEVLPRSHTAGQSRNSPPTPMSAHCANGDSELFAAIAAPITASEINSTSAMIAALRVFRFHIVFSRKCRFSHSTSEGGFAVVTRSFVGGASAASVNKRMSSFPLAIIFARASLGFSAFGNRSKERFFKRSFDSATFVMQSTQVCSSTKETHAHTTGKPCCAHAATASAFCSRRTFKSAIFSLIFSGL
mmetsp:Transcript_6238/g.20910  ORF Transcript_6238/g.20910 Transcript_6238/m.20910 type:complete len:217 (-) Transcript_6238:1399-2049(-)